MTTALALDYIARRVRELGYGDSYSIRFRHLVLGPGEIIHLEADNEFYLIVEPMPEIRVSSDFGMYDLNFDKLNEQLYEHQGNIKINANHPTKEILHVRLIQVIPKHSN